MSYSVEKEQKTVRDNIGRIANDLSAKPENKSKSRDELVSEAIDVYYSNGEVRNEQSR